MSTYFEVVENVTRREWGGVELGNDWKMFQNDVEVAVPSPWLKPMSAMKIASGPMTEKALVTSHFVLWASRHSQELGL